MTSPLPPAHEQLRALLHLYAERFDDGDIDGAAALFDRAVFDIGAGGRLDHHAMTALWKRIVLLYDGRPRTRHVITNATFEIDSARAGAQGRSTYIVYQALEDFPLQVIMIGRYFDSFVEDMGRWRFAERRYLADLVGDVSRHLTAEACRQFLPAAKDQSPQ